MEGSSNEAEEDDMDGLDGSADEVQLFDDEGMLHCARESTVMGAQWNPEHELWRLLSTLPSLAYTLITQTRK